MLKNITVSPAPHVSKAHSTRSIMFDVLLGLTPAMIAACIYFRLAAITVIAACVVTCMVTEFLCNLILKRSNSLGDLSAVVTGVILAFSLSPAIPLWACVVGSFFAIAIGKMVFGGLGANIFNPAMAARAFMAASFGALMTTWAVPATIASTEATIHSANQATVTEFTPLTQATPLAHSKSSIKGTQETTIVTAMFKQSLTGETGGCLGETSTLALIIGGIFLLIKRTINIHIPAAVLLSAFAVAAIAWFVNPDKYIVPHMHLMTGGLLLCAFFIATDPVTAPMTRTGMWIFGIGVGVLIMLIRIIGEYPEGIMYAILIMNALSPLIDRFVKLTPAGGKVNV